jgi:FkbM family methyltransferase
MLKLTGRFLKSIANLLYKISNRIESYRTLPRKNHEIPRDNNIRQWFEEEGDKTHRLNYLLNEDSIVFDLGGYEGEWASQIFCLYGSNIYIFEPYVEYFDNIKNRFGHNKKVSVFQVGLSKNNQTTKLAIAENSSSIFIQSDQSADIELVSADEFFAQHQIAKVDLMKINIEGGEYDLLEHIIETGLINRINNIQVQFHDFVPDAVNRMKAIQESLSKTHHLTYQYEFVWENWKHNTQ